MGLVPRMFEEMVASDLSLELCLVYASVLMKHFNFRNGFSDSHLRRTCWHNSVSGNIRVGQIIDIWRVIFANGSWLTKSTINFSGKLPIIQYLHHNGTHLNRHHHQIVVTKKSIQIIWFWEEYDTCHVYWSEPHTSMTLLQDACMCMSSLRGHIPKI